MNEVLTHDNDVRIALETMAGKGSEVGRTFEKLLRSLMASHIMIDYQSVSIHVTLMIFGYNIKEDFDGVLNEFDKIIGLDRIKVVHVNDSKMSKVLIKIDMKILDSVTLDLTH